MPLRIEITATGDGAEVTIHQRNPIAVQFIRDGAVIRSRRGLGELTSDDRLSEALESLQDVVCDLIRALRNS